MSVEFARRADVEALIGRSPAAVQLADELECVAGKIRDEPRPTAQRFLLENWIDVMARVFMFYKSGADECRRVQEGHNVFTEPPAV